MKLDKLKKEGSAPTWMTEESFITLCGGYLLKEETPRQMYERVAKAAAFQLAKNNGEYNHEIANKYAGRFFDLMWNNWLCPASPVLSNMGTTRGLPISCFSNFVGDSVQDIMGVMTETAIMTKNGGGVGSHWSAVRPRGSHIKGNGKSDGIIPFMKILDSTIVGISQGGVRRGAGAAYLDIEHGDFDEFLNMRRPAGDANRQCLNMHHSVCVSDAFMAKVRSGDKEARRRWKEVLKLRLETGEPFIFFSDNVNNANPECYKERGFVVKGSNICCLSGDTLVLTSIGPARIDELCGKNVQLWDGENWVENNTISMRGVDKLHRIKIADGSFVDSNANHRWFVASSYDGIRKNSYKEILTKDLRLGQWIECHTAPEVHGSIVEPAAYLKGFLIGDGTHIDDRPLLRLHSTKYMCEESLKVSAEELPIDNTNTNAICEISFSEEYEPVESAAYGIQKLKNMKGLSARKFSLIKWVTEFRSSLPKEIFSWDRQSKLSFISGLLDSDGTVSKNNSIQISSISEQLIKDLQLLLKTLNYSSNIDVMFFCDQNRNTCYRLTVSSFDGWHLIKNGSMKRLKVKGKKPNRKLTGWRRIVDISELDKEEAVYCPTLPTTGKFALANGLMTGNTEITGYTDELHSFVCCLSSMNLARWDEWKDTDAVQIAIWFLDAVMSEFIERAASIAGMEKAIRFAEKSRMLGLGVLGWHTLLQEKSISFDSMEAYLLNGVIFKTIHKEANSASLQLAEQYGEPEWLKGTGRRNSHLIALAPTASNSIISGGLSASIEPWPANAFAQKTAKGTFMFKNKKLEELLTSLNQNTDEVWRSIVNSEGSVAHLDFLTPEQKKVFETAREMNQFVLIKLAAARQKYIDQAQSLNLFFPANVAPKYYNEVHMHAHELGIKTLYYTRSTSVLKGDSGFKEYRREISECSYCEG